MIHARRSDDDEVKAVGADDAVMLNVIYPIQLLATAGAQAGHPKQGKKTFDV
jgi:hypothetical protein